MCGDPEAPETYFAGFPKDKVSPISCPDNVAFDRGGNLWISTDGNALGVQRRALPGAGGGPRAGPRPAVPHRAARRRDLRAAASAATDGSVFVGVQHPGEVTAPVRATRQHLARTPTFPRPAWWSTYRA